MARKRDALIFEPMYKPRPAEGTPAKRKRPWRAVLRLITLGLACRTSSHKPTPTLADFSHRLVYALPVCAVRALSSLLRRA